MRPALVLAACAAALVTTSPDASGQRAVETRSCAQAGPFFSVQVAGNIAATYYAQPLLHGELFASIPRREAMVAIWTFGTQSNLEPFLYGWVAGPRSRIAARCAPRGALRAPSGSLRATIRVQDGWAIGRRYECARRGRVVLQIATLRDRTRLTVWMEATRELVAVAEIGQDGGWLRASKRCEEEDP